MNLESKLECFTLASFNSLFLQMVLLSMKIHKLWTKKFYYIGPWTFFETIYSEH
jgi:hypothetical protein